MTYEYTVKIFSMDELTEQGVVVHAEKNIVFACRPEGACEVHDMAEEHTDNLARLFNGMGKEGWELIQLFFRPMGIVSFWKRALVGKQD